MASSELRQMQTSDPVASFEHSSWRRLGFRSSGSSVSRSRGRAPAAGSAQCARAPRSRVAPPLVMISAAGIAEIGDGSLGLEAIAVAFVVGIALDPQLLAALGIGGGAARSKAATATTTTESSSPNAFRSSGMSALRPDAAATPAFIATARRIHASDEFGRHASPRHPPICTRNPARRVLSRRPRVESEER